MTDILLQNNGKPWITSEGKTVPKTCPTCGGDVGLFLFGQPVFLCKKNDKHYFGVLAFKPPREDEE